MHISQVCAELNSTVLLKLSKVIMSEQLTKPVFECTDNLIICQMSPIFVFLFYKLRLLSETPAVWERIQKRGLERIRSHNFDIPTQPCTYFLHLQVSASVWGSEGGFSAWKRPGGSNLPQLGRPPLRNWWTCWLFPFCPSRPSSPPLAPSQTPPLCQLLPPPTQWQIEEWFDGTDLSLINPKLTMFHDPIFKYYYMNQLSLSQLIR